MISWTSSCLTSLSNRFQSKKKQTYIYFTSSTNLTKLKTQIKSEIRITPTAVNEEIKLLQSYIGDDAAKNVLKAIKHISEVEFNNGCRAPTWRQMHGDITYLIIQPFNQDSLTVTCNRSGIYENNVSYNTLKKKQYQLINPHIYK